MKNLNLSPVLYQIEDQSKALGEFESQIRQQDNGNMAEVILEYPTVYIHSWAETEDYEVYIGESGDVIQRTRQHYALMKKKGSWQNKLLTSKASLYIIGHKHFNKSLTLDIENRLMLYMMSAERIKKIHNKKGNPQNRYYPDHEFDSIFQKIWRKLRRNDPVLFPAESTIRDSAVFKASPLHKLTLEQEHAKALIIQKVVAALSMEKENQIIFVEGEAGTGKTVLNSSTFYELLDKSDEQKHGSIQCCLMVNHDEQITVYQQIAKKLGLTDKNEEVVCKPTHFINSHTPKEPIDVAFIDEAHLLWTQGKQAYKGDNQLQDIMDRARVTVVMFDEDQVLTTEQFWEHDILDGFRSKAKNQGNYIELKHQLRITANQETIRWIDAFTKQQELYEIPYDDRGYDIRIFKTPEELDCEIKKKAKGKNTALSRLIATYDWEYNAKRGPESRFLKYWEVLVGDWHKPWNRELQKNMDRKDKRAIKHLSWAEQPHTVNEVGSTFTIQGFDLNYAGVILGPSVKYQNGKIVFDPSASANNKAVRNRTLADGSRQKYGETLIRHEVRVLMTRGVSGLYIYACDDNLRNALLHMAAGRDAT